MIRSVSSLSIYHHGGWEKETKDQTAACPVDSPDRLFPSPTSRQKIHWTENYLKEPREEMTAHAGEQQHVQSAERNGRTNGEQVLATCRRANRDDRF